MIIFPLPPSTLSPNARVHWRVKAKAAKKYKSDCYMQTIVWIDKEYLRSGIYPSQFREILGIYDKSKTLEITLQFCFAQNRKRDDDNLIASFKSGRDGMADALGIDDSRIKIKAVEIVVDKARAGSVYVSVHSNQ